MARMTEEQRARRQAERKAARLNAKATEQAGLFAGLLKTDGGLTTAKDQYWNWRKQKAGGNYSGPTPTSWFGVGLCALNEAQYGLAWIELHAIEREAATLLGSDFEDARAYIRRTYPMPDYGPHVWADLLTRGRQLPIRHEVRFDPAKAGRYNPEGKYVIETLCPAEAKAVISPEAWAAKFPQYTPPPEQPNDGGLADRLAALFTPATEE